MKTMSLLRRLVRTASVVALGGVAASCGIEKQSAPALAGPSELATSISMTATPDVLSRDGASQATITLTARNADATPLPGLPINLSLNPVNGGSLSASQVTTDAAGRAVFTLTAPSLDTVLNSVVIGATPVGTNFATAVTRSISVALTGPSAATPAFTVTPTSPQRFQLASLNASGTTFEGAACSTCTYAWTIGSEATLSGQVVNYRFQREATYAVVLEVTAPSGIKTRTQQNVAVSAALAPTAAITFSPSNPRVGDQVFFNGGSSTAPNGATITEYTWDFGGGQAAATGVSASTTYTAARTYVVRLTVRDSNGQTATTTVSVSVAVP